MNQLKEIRHMMIEYSTLNLGRKETKMNKCSINNDRGQCKNKPTKYIFGIELCDNHHHILFYL